MPRPLTTSENAPDRTVGREVRSYHQLIQAFELRPIRSEDHLRAATAMMRSLLGIELTPDEDDYLNVLGTLIYQYESEHLEMPSITQADVLRAFMEDRNVSKAELAASTGIPDSNISAMLANRRGINKTCRAVFAEFFEVSPNRFLIARSLT